MVLIEDNIITTDKNKLIEVTTKFYSDIYKAQEIKDENFSHNQGRDISSSREKSEKIHKNIKKVKTGGKVGIVTELI